MDKPDWNARRQYMRWEAAIAAMCDAYRALEARLGMSGEAAARSRFHAAVRQVDVYTLPEPWKSWEHLGHAIHAQPYKPRSWSKENAA
jgi:hypothetical protein